MVMAAPGPTPEVQLLAPLVAFGSGWSISVADLPINQHMRELL